MRCKSDLDDRGNSCVKRDARGNYRRASDLERMIRISADAQGFCVVRDLPSHPMLGTLCRAQWRPPDAHRSARMRRRPGFARPHSGAHRSESGAGTFDAGARTYPLAGALGGALSCALHSFRIRSRSGRSLGDAAAWFAGPRVAPGDRGEESPTDGLLSASVSRVVRASRRICAALGLEMEGPASEPQAAVDLEATAGEEIVLEYEQHGMGDFLGPPEAL